MNYTTNNEFHHFRFTEAIVDELSNENKSFCAILDNVIILPENTTNRDIFEMSCNELYLTIPDGTITSFIEEGYKRYDADDHLLAKIPDRILTEAEYPDKMKDLIGCYVISIEKKEDVYEFSIDTDDHAYTILVKGNQDTEAWDRYMKKTEG